MKPLWVHTYLARQRSSAKHARESQQYHKRGAATTHHCEGANGLFHSGGRFRSQTFITNLCCCSSWMHFLFGISHPLNCHEREIAQSLWHGSVVCSVGRLSKTRNRQLSGYQGGHHRREIDPPPVIIRAVLRFHNRGSQHFEKSKNCLNYCQFWPVLWWKSSVLENWSLK
jgi:hypothetical protein